MTILQRMHPLFTNQPVPEVTDNACGAVCRMITAGGAQLPLDKVLPVLLSALPLQKDFIENETVFKTLLGLIREGNPVVCVCARVYVRVCVYGVGKTVPGCYLALRLLPVKHHPRER